MSMGQALMNGTLLIFRAEICRNGGRYHVEHEAWNTFTET